MSTTVLRSKWFGLYDREMPAAAVLPYELSKVQVPPRDRDQIKAALENHGLPANETEIAKWYIKGQQNSGRRSAVAPIEPGGAPPVESRLEREAAAMRRSFEIAGDRLPGYLRDAAGTYGPGLLAAMAAATRYAITDVMDGTTPTAHRCGRASASRSKARFRNSSGGGRLRRRW